MKGDSWIFFLCVLTYYASLSSHTLLLSISLKLYTLVLSKKIYNERGELQFQHKLFILGYIR